MDLLTVNLSLFPLTDEYQVGKVTSVTTTPSTSKITQGEGSVIITWDALSNEKEFTYKITGDVTTQNKNRKIRRMQKFPLNDLDPAYIPYTEPTEMIDLNENITKKAVEIIGGETDLYKIIFKLAEWVNENVEYDLTTLTAEAVQKSSWVFDNRRGVCDEITNLYISMLRSVGVPARFVAGQAYTNIGNKFGNHGWSEVYYPGEGWIPVDVTYDQIGWVDPTHIKFKISADSSASSADYSWKSMDIDLKFEDITITPIIKNEYLDLEKQVKITLEPMKYKAGPGSYVPIQAIIENDNDYYVPLKITVKKAPKLIDEKVAKSVLLAPHDSTSVFWIVGIPENMDLQTVYTTTIEVYSPVGGTAENTIKFADSYEVVTKTWAEDITTSLSKREEKSYFPNLEWTCIAEKAAYYKEETATLLCNAKNVGNTGLENIKFCFEEDCKTRSLEQGAAEKLEWRLPLLERKSGKLIVIAESESLIRYAYPSIKIISDPKVQILNLNQQPIPYDSRGNITFTINSEDYAKNVVVTMNKIGNIELKELEGGYDVIIPYTGKAFYNGIIEMGVTYEDELGKKYENKQTFSAVITNIPWYLQLLNWINKSFETNIQV